VVSRLKQAGVTVIYIGGYYTEAALIIRQAKSRDEDDPGQRRCLVTKEVLEYLRSGWSWYLDDVLARSAEERGRGESGKEFKDQKIDPRLRSLTPMPRSNLG